MALVTLIGLVASLVGVAALTLPFAEAIAGWMMERRLAAVTREPVSVSVAALGLDGAIIDSIKVGDSLQLTGVHLRWRLRPLLDRRLDELTVEYAHVRPQGGAGLDGVGWAVDRVHIGHALIEAPLPWGRRPFSLSLDFDGITGRGLLSVAEMGSATLQEDDGVLWLRAESPWKVDLGDGRVLTITGRDGGDWRLALRTLPSGGYEAATALGIRATIPEAEGLTVTADGRITLGAGTHIDVPALNAEIRGLRVGGGRVDATIELLQARGDRSGGEARAALEIKARDLDTGDLRLRHVDLRLGGGVTYDGRRFQLALDGPGSLDTGDADFGEFFAVSPASLTILPGATIEASLSEDGVMLRPDVAIQGELSLRAGGVRMLATIPRCDVGGDIAWPEGPLLPGVTLSDATLDVVEWSWRAADVVASMAPSPTGPALQFSASRLGPAEGGVMSATAQVSPVEDGLRLSAHLVGPGVDIALAGFHDLLGGGGSLTLESAPITFAPGKLQPRQLFPGLGAFSQVSGTAAMAGAVSWSRTRFTPDLRITLQDMGGHVGSVAAHHLDAGIHLDGLAPLSTPPNQRASVQRIDSAVPLTDGRLTFRLDRGRVMVARASAQLAGGMVSVTDAVVDPRATRQQLTLAVAGLDLAQVIEMIQVDGLSGSGRLTGTIPLVLAQGDVTIASARLDSIAPGVLRYQPSDPSGIAGMGESMDLVLKALDDFHYTKLSMTLHGEAGGDLLAGMTINGANPGLYDGYPIELNLNVSGKLGSILDKARITDELPDILRRPSR